MVPEAECLRWLGLELRRWLQLVAAGLARAPLAARARALEQERVPELQEWAAGLLVVRQAVELE